MDEPVVKKIILTYKDNKPKRSEIDEENDFLDFGQQLMKLQKIYEKLKSKRC